MSDPARHCLYLDCVKPHLLCQQLRRATLPGLYPPNIHHLSLPTYLTTNLLYLPVLTSTASTGFKNHESHTCDCSQHKEMRKEDITGQIWCALRLRMMRKKLKKCGQYFCLHPARLFMTAVTPSLCVCWNIKIAPLSALDVEC